MTIHKYMTISKIFETFPHKSQKIAAMMTSFGLQCVGCGAATYETLEAGTLGHGMTEGQLEALIGRLNDILAEEQDLSKIMLTPRAAEKFIEIGKEEGLEKPMLRFGDQPGGCSGFEYVLDFSEGKTERDEVFESHGVEIHVDRGSLERLRGTEIDYTDGLRGAGFKVSNPNARSSCG